MSNQFVHLHTHSHYSILDGLAKIPHILAKVKESGMTTVAITDHGNMYGAIEFYKKAKEAGIKPIIGQEMYLAPNGRLNKSGKEDAIRHHIIILSRTYEGYKNLIQLTSKAHLEGFYYKPRIDKELLKQHAAGLIGLSGCLGGEISQAILKNNLQKAEQIALEYKAIFEEGCFFLEIAPHPHIPEQKIVNQALIELSKKCHIPLVLTGDSHYINKEDAKSQDILLAVQTKTTINNPNRFTMNQEDFSLKTPAEMWELGQDLPEEALTNTVKIAEMCEVEIPLYQIQLPSFDTPKKDDGTAQTNYEYLVYLCEQGIPRRYPDQQPENLRQRLQYELEVINTAGYSAYFLIVSDFISWARNNDIVVGPGRGSAAGSLVAYLTGITDLDPLKYDLLFERFLNPSRVSMPDIDVDFADNKRDLVLEYVTQKYGKERVAQIITFGTMAARAALRDTGRALGYSYTLCDSVSKLIPFQRNISQALEEVPELKEKYDQDERVKLLIDNALKLEGVVRHTSTHACAVVIAKDPLHNHAPVQLSESHGKEAVITQYEMHAIEDLGLLKMDFLGLANLSIIKETLDLIQKNHYTNIDISRLKMTDKKAFKLFQKGQTTGVFQFESAGMKKALQGLKPTVFDDLIAMVSLYRPGPMELIPSFIDRKRGKEPIKYLHPKMEPILKNTYGIMIYQEQLMKASQEIAGFTLPEADVLRKAIGKKIKELLDEQKDKIIQGTVNNGIERHVGERLWELIEPFARYGFNKSHAACYALIAYQTAYLKAHYTAEFLVSLMNSDTKDLKRIAIEVQEARQLGLEVLPPSVNYSYAQFTNRGNVIRFGLASVRNLSEKLSQELVLERDKNGKFSSLEDLISRVKSKHLNKKGLEALSKSGALDEFEARETVLENIESVLEYIKRAEKTDVASNQSSLFGNSVSDHPGKNLVLIPTQLSTEVLQKKYLDYEKEFLGLYVSSHPINACADKITELQIPLISSLKENKKRRAIIATGILHSIKKIITKKGETMLFAELEDQYDSIEIIIFPSVYKTCHAILEPGQCLVIKGSLDNGDNMIKVIARDLRNLYDPKIASWMLQKGASRPDETPSNLIQAGQKSNAPDSSSFNSIKGVNILLRKQPSKEMLQTLKSVLMKQPKGDCSVYFILNPETLQAKVIPTSFKVKYSEFLLDTLKQITSIGS